MTAIAPDRLTELDVLTDTGVLLVSIPVPGHPQSHVRTTGENR
jgi:hypothetical protein